MDLVGDCEVVDGVVQRGLRALRQATNMILIFGSWSTMMIMLLVVMRTITPYCRADDWGRGLCWDAKGRSHWRPWSGQGIEIVVIVKWQYSIHHGWIKIVIMMTIFQHMNNHDHYNPRHLHHHRSRQRRCHLSDGTWEGAGRRLQSGSHSHRSLRIHNDDWNWHYPIEWW